jgi:hypothetical protein
MSSRNREWAPESKLRSAQDKMRKSLNFLSEQENGKQANGDENRDRDERLQQKQRQQKPDRKQRKQEEPIKTEAKIKWAEIKKRSWAERLAA